MPYSNSGYKSINKQIHIYHYSPTYIVPLWLTTSHILPCQSETITQLPPFYSDLISVQLIPSIWTVTHKLQKLTHKLQTYPDNKGLASLQTGLLIICCISLDVTLHLQHLKQPLCHFALDTGITLPR